MEPSIIKLPIPRELAHPFFFTEKESIVEIPSDNISSSENFLYEIYYYNGISARRPWMDLNEVMITFMGEWRKIKSQLEALHHERDQKNILQSMKKGIGLFIQLLFWSNEKPVQLTEQLSFDELPFKPVNVQERLNFIISRPKLFHSFIQLSELIGEQEKLYAKKIIQKKVSTSTI